MSAGCHIADEINGPILGIFAYASINPAKFGRRTSDPSKGGWDYESFTSYALPDFVR